MSKSESRINTQHVLARYGKPKQRTVDQAANGNQHG
jgi:hypothetical protein